MCFSVQADLVAATVVAPLAGASLREVRHRRELPFALLPAVFCLHQLIEAVVWAGTDGDVSAGLAHAAAVAYVAIALPLLPTYVPGAVILLEPAGRRRRVLPFLLLGVTVTVAMTVTLARHGVGVRVHPHALEYQVGLAHGLVWTVLYVVAVIGASLLSGYRSIVAFGVLNLVGLAAVAWLYSHAFASVWCVYAALTSALVVVHLHRRRRLSDAERLGVPATG